MLASKHFKIRRKADDDWFDPILNTDTELFVDPFLVFKEAAGPWASAHAAIIAHFDRAFRLIAEGNQNPESIAYQKALALLVFREPKELCLGYTAKGTGGAGSGKGYAEAIGSAIVDAIKRGINNPKHFEELGILNEGIGRDRISDVTCTILKEKLIGYTQEIAKRHAIQLHRHELYGASFDERRQRWESPAVPVPTNPRTGGPLLFVPSRFLRELPLLNATDWWDNYENEMLRQDLNYEIMGHVNKATIVAIARRHPDLVRKWTIQKEEEPANPYDFARDPKGVWKWEQATADFAEAHPVRIPAAKDHAEFIAAIEQVIQQFRLFVEEQGGWFLLWDSGGKDKPELAVQLLFKGIAQQYCAANNISIDREVDLGRGPVDFKFSTGFHQRAHLEIKKLHNGKFWNGLEEQLPSYMKSDQVADGWFVAVLLRESKQTAERLKVLPSRVRSVAKDRGIRLRLSVIDATRKKSASKL